MQPLENNMIGFKLNLHKQSGRSMIEMLGVLSIIGILSVTALFRYNYAITKYKVNETWSELEQRTMAGIIKLPAIKETMSGEFQLEEFKNFTTMGYPVTQTKLDESHFDITLDQVPAKVCRLLIETKPDDFYVIYVNGQFATQPDLCSEQNKMIFEIGQDPSLIERCETNADCTRICDSCQSGICKSNCQDDMKCTRSTAPYDRYQCCKPEKILNGTCCSDVKTGDDGQKVCCTTHGKCCPIGYFDPYPASQSQCLPCDDPGDYILRSPNFSSIDYSNCFACPNRVVNGWSCSMKCKPKTHLDPSGFCFCDNPYSMQDSAGNCYTCDEATAETYLWNWRDSQGCVSCNYRPANGYCFKCPHGTVAKGVNNASECAACPDDVSGLPSKNQCLSCDGNWNDSTKKCEK